MQPQIHRSDFHRRSSTEGLSRRTWQWQAERFRVVGSILKTIYPAYTSYIVVLRITQTGAHCVVGKDHVHDLLVDQSLDVRELSPAARKRGFRIT
eukprot:7014242-Pyramimonas_sp.AAC.1